MQKIVASHQNAQLQEKLSFTVSKTEKSLNQKEPLLNQILPNTSISWPFFKQKQSSKFWNNRNTFYKSSSPLIIFEGSLLRIGKAKKSQKGYVYRIDSNGVLSYFKKVTFKNISAAISRNQI